MEFERLLREIGVIPVVEIPHAEYAVTLAEALVRAGLPCAEITFRTSSAAAAIEAIASALPGFCVGAGTVLSIRQAEAALAAGASFLVSPGFDSAVVDFAQERGVPMLPGVCTPTEIGSAESRGVSLVKLFPAEPIGGVAYLKAVAAPYRSVRFVPTGGVDPGNLAAYLAVPQVAACGGSWMVKKDLLTAGDFDKICELTAAAVALANEARLPGAGGEERVDAGS